MRGARQAVLAVAVLLALGPAARAQHLRGVGSGPSTGFFLNLPSYGINRTIGAAGEYATGSQFSRGGQVPTPGSTWSGLEVSLLRNRWTPIGPTDLAKGPGLAPLVNLRFRTIESLNFEKRARFAALRETTLALAERVRQAGDASLGQIKPEFRQFMVPLPILDRPAPGYGFFSRMDLVGGGGVDPETFLGPFTQEVQQSLGEPRFLDAAQALLLNRPLPEGMALDQFYDTQLAALANHLFNNARYTAAARCWEILAARDATSPTMARALALGLLASGQMARASAEFRRSFTLAPGWPDDLRVTGSNLQDVFPSMQDLSAVRAELQALLERKADDPDLNFLRAVVDLLHGSPAAAGERLARLAPQDEVARHLAARVEAGAVAESVLRPAQTALKRVAEGLTGLEEPEMSPEARARLAAALRGGPQDFDDYMRVGDFRFFMGDFTLADEAYRAAHKSRPDDAFAMFALVHAAFANGEYRQAGRYLGEALRLERDWGLYEFRLQEFYGDPAEYQRHVRNLVRQVELRPDDPHFKFLLAYVHYFSGRYADAAELLLEVLRREPGLEAANYFLRLARLQR